MLCILPTSSIKLKLLYSHNPFFSPSVEVFVLEGYVGNSFSYLVIRFPSTPEFPAFDKIIRLNKNKCAYVELDDKDRLDLETDIPRLAILSDNQNFRLNSRIYRKMTKTEMLALASLDWVVD